MKIIPTEFQTDGLILTINDFISVLLSNVLFVIIMVSLLKFKITQNHKIIYECQMKVFSKFHLPIVFQS